MGDRPVAVVESRQLYYIRTDHIGRPVFATDVTTTKVWEVSYLPFGGVHVASLGARELRACIRTGCATTTQPQAAISKPTHWG